MLAEHPQRARLRVATLPTGTGMLGTDGSGCVAGLLLSAECGVVGHSNLLQDAQDSST